MVIAPSSKTCYLRHCLGGQFDELRSHDKSMQTYQCIDRYYSLESFSFGLVKVEEAQMTYLFARGRVR